MWNGLNFDLVNPQSTWINHVTQVLYLNMKEPTFAWMKLKVMFLKSSKHFSQMVHMISWGQAKNNDVINVAFGKSKTR